MTTALAAPILADAARHYAEVGWYVHPLRPQAKLPATRHGVLDATNDVARVEAWWRLLPRANIGIATGPSGLLVVDLDGETGRLSWTRLAGRNGGHERTRVAETGKPDGLHIYLEGDGPSTAGRLGPGIDTRGRGGYVIASPSVHPNGRRYRLRDAFAPIADAPVWLLDLLKPAPPPPVGERGSLPPGARATPYGRAALEGLADDLLGAVAGTRNATLHRTACRAGRLVAAGELDADLARDVLAEAAGRVGLRRGEIAATWRSGFHFGQQFPAVRGPR